MSESLLWLLFDSWNAKRQGIAAVTKRQKDRLAEMVNFARANSPYYHSLYRDLPERIEDHTLLPVTNKKDLMAHFDDWATDREVTMEKARKFVDNPKLVGERFLGTHTLVTTSGTTGTRGIFLIDDRSLAVTNAIALRMFNDWLDIGDLIRILIGAGRTAMVIATSGHFSTTVASVLLRKGSWLRSKLIRVFPVHMHVPKMVTELNQFRPVILAPYASIAALLASEQKLGHLHINPVLLVPTAEGLPPSEYDRIARVFNTKVRNSYAATECAFLSYSCEYGWLHVNSDWVMLEPVDADYQPVPPGEQSYTVLISNLANRVQPILRYDLGDSILQRPDPCPCGNPLPAIRVQGRAADMLTFSTNRGEKVTIAPLIFITMVDRIQGIELIQIVQTTPTNLRVRMRLASGIDADQVWHVVHTEITRLLSEHELDHVTVERADEPPEQSSGGKYREVIPLRD